MSLEYAAKLGEMGRKQAQLEATLVDLVTRYTSAVNDIADLKRRLAILEEKRGPGRPPKNGG